MQGILFDLRFALRTLARNPGFTAIAILTLALGIGANTAIFTVFDAVLLKPLPYTDPGRLVAIQEVVPPLVSIAPSLPVSAWHFREWRKSSRTFEQLALLGSFSTVLTTRTGEPERIPMARVSASLFPLLGIQAQVGRTFLEDEDRPGHDLEVILSDRLWSRRFHRDPAVIGRKVLLDGYPYQVVGVLPAGARLPRVSELHNLAFSDTDAEMWKPFAIRDSELAIMAEFNFACIGRLKPGFSIAQATADLDAVQSAIVKDIAERPELRAAITGLQDQIAGRSRQGLVLLLAAVGAVLLIVCVNIANLMLARAVARTRELAIRTALGAGIRRLLRQTMTESLLVAIAGGALGAALARWALATTVLRAPVDLPRLRDVRMDVHALAFAAAVTIASGVLFGLLPAWRMARTDPQVALKSGSRGVTERGSARRLLIGAEVALSAMCLVVGGLLLNSFIRLMRVDMGFQPDRAVTVGLGLPFSRYPDTKARVAFVRSLLDRIRPLPGVVAAGTVNRLPLTGEGSNNSIYVEGAAADSRRPIVDYRCVTPGYFRAIGVPLVSGRIFSEADGDRRVALVSARAARQLWPEGSPIGRRFRLGAPDQPPIEVVGIAGDVHGVSLQKAPNPTVYLPYWQRDRADLSLVVRTAMDPLSIATAIRGAIHGLDPELPVPRALALDQVVDASVRQRRFQLSLVLLFAAAALLLAVVGVYGVVSHSVTQRTGEIGIRMALGASRSDVWRMVVRHGLAPVAGGLVAGLVGALAAGRLVSGMLFGVRAADPLTFAAVAFTLLSAALAACAIPALRGTRVDPMVALRYE